MNTTWRINYAIASDKLRKSLDDVTSSDNYQLTASDNWADNIDGKHWAYIVMGIGDGRHIKALFERISKHSQIVIIEKELSRVKHALEQCDFSLMIDSQRVFLLHNADFAEINRILMATRDLLNRKVLVTPVLTLDDYDWRNLVMDAVLSYADAQRTHIITKIANSRITCDNLLDNTEYIECENAACLKGILKKATAIVVAAGPSMDRDLEVLKSANRDNVVLIAALTMLKPLLQNDIVPDYVTALDYHLISGKFFDEISQLPDSVSFIIEPKVNHAVIKRIRELGALKKLYFLASPWLDTVCAIPRKADGQFCSGTTVAHFSFSLAEHLGCDPIIMIGHDMAFTDGKYYPACVYDAHKWKKPYRDPNNWQVSRMVKDLNDKDIPTNEQFQCYCSASSLFGMNASRR